VTTKTTAGGA